MTFSTAIKKHNNENQITDMMTKYVGNLSDGVAGFNSATIADRSFA